MNPTGMVWAIVMSCAAIIGSLVVGIIVTLLKAHLDSHAKALNSAEDARSSQLKALVKDEVGKCDRELRELMNKNHGMVAAGLENLSLEAGKDRMEMKRVVGSILKWQKIFETRFHTLQAQANETKVFVERIAKKGG